MLTNIKSIKLLKLLFSFLKNNIKLKVAKNNKQIRKQLNISLFDYQLLSGKYIINEENKRTVKELSSYNDQIIYEEEYLNGKRNGKGKEFYYGELIFDGEFLNGKRNGKGKEFNEFGTLIFEGEYLNGKKWKGKGYDRKKNKKVIYEIKEGDCKNVAE